MTLNRALARSRPGPTGRRCALVGRWDGPGLYWIAILYPDGLTEIQAWEFYADGTFDQVPIPGDPDRQCWRPFR